MSVPTSATGRGLGSRKVSFLRSFAHCTDGAVRRRRHSPAAEESSQSRALAFVRRGCSAEGLNRKSQKSKSTSPVPRRPFAVCLRSKSATPRFNCHVSALFGEPLAILMSVFRKHRLLWRRTVVRSPEPIGRQVPIWAGKSSKEHANLHIGRVSMLFETNGSATTAACTLVFFQTR